MQNMGCGNEWMINLVAPEHSSWRFESSSGNLYDTSRLLGYQQRICRIGIGIMDDRIRGGWRDSLNGQSPPPPFVMTSPVRSGIVWQNMQPRSVLPMEDSSICFSGQGGHVKSPKPLGAPMWFRPTSFFF